MNVVSSQTELALKNAGLPQPTPQPGMMFYLDNTLCMLCRIRQGGLEMELQAVGSSEKYYPGKEQFSIIGVFAPDADYIASQLSGLECGLWINQLGPYCDIVDERSKRRYYRNNLAESAADVYIEQNAPTSDFSKMGDAEQE